MTDREHRLRLPMRPRAELEAVAEARRLMAEADMDASAAAEVEMALIEAIINAVEHSRAPAGHLDVYMRVTPSSFEVSVKDSGRGFDPNAVERVDAVRKRERGETRGWGLEIIRRSMDHVDIDCGVDGTSITMIKNR